MAYNENLADRVREILSETEKNITEIKMFSGLCFMVNEKMCVGMQQGKMMVRLNPETYETALEKEGVVPMNMKGKVMKGFVLVNDDVLNTKKKLGYWIDLALAFIKIAKPAKKKKKVPKKNGLH